MVISNLIKTWISMVCMKVFQRFKVKHIYIYFDMQNDDMQTVFI